MELGSGPKVSKKYNKKNIKKTIDPAARREHGGKLSHPIPPSDKLCQSGRKHEKRRGKDNRDNTGIVNFEGNIGTSCALRLVPSDHPSRILEGYSSLSL